MGGDTVITLILKAGPVVKFVLLLLLFFSVVSWAIIVFKFRLFSKVEKESSEFRKHITKANTGIHFISPLKDMHSVHS